MALHASRPDAGLQKRSRRIHSIEKICRQDKIKFSKLSAQSGCVADLEPAPRPVDLRGQVPGNWPGKVSLDPPKNPDLARFADFLGGRDEATGKVDTNYFSGKTRQFKGRAPDRTAKIERAVTAFAGSANGGLITTASGLAAVHRDLIVTLAALHKLPAIYYERYLSPPAD